MNTMQKLLLIIIEQVKDFVYYIRDMMIFFACIAGLLVVLALGIGALCFVLFPRTSISYAAYYAGEFMQNMRYEALQEAQAGYEAVFLELVESYKEYEDTFTRVEEVSKKYRLRNQAIKEAVDKANSLIAEFESKQKEAKEAFEYAQGQIHADKEAVHSYTAQLEQVLQAQQKAIYALQEYIQTQTLESLQAKNKRK